MKKLTLALLACAAIAQASFAVGGIVNPDCTPEKAAKSAAAKATVGKGGRCSPAEAAKDTGKKVAGVEDKGPVKKATGKDHNPVEKTKDAAKAVVN
jgi:hypothetical protein